MANLVKTTFFLVDGRNNGWSFSLYREQASSELDPNALDAKALAAAMAPLLGEGVKFTYCRDSFDGIRGDGSLTEFAAIADYSGAVGKPMEQAGSCLHFQLANQALTKKKPIFIHGIWDTKITGGVLQDPPGWSTKMTTFKNIIKAKPWGWKGVDTKTATAITTVTATASNKLLITVADPVFLGPFDGRTQQVQVNGVGSIPSIRNPLVVIPKTATTCVTKNKFADPVVDGGQLTVKTYTFYPAIKTFEIRATTKRVGRPFRPQAGGRSRRR
jgi:hypothetical protein